jgi:hypothetical protein
MEVDSMARGERPIHCAVDDCLRAVKARGWCNLHYKRWKRNGHPLATYRASADLSPGEFVVCSAEGCDRSVRGDGRCYHHYYQTVRRQNYGGFFDRVDVEDCWNWVASKDKDGYGKFRQGNVHWRAHRFAWELLVGPIPDGFVIDHLCRNRACVNPDHLEPVTSAENVRRGLLPEKVWNRGRAA